MIQLTRSIYRLGFCILLVASDLHAGSAKSPVTRHTIAQDAAFKAFITKEALVKKKEFVVFPDIQKILNHGVLTVALLKDDIFPFFFYDKKEGFLGIDRQMINSIARALGSNIKLKIIRTAKTYDEVIEQVSNGSAHIGVSKINYTSERSLKVVYGDVSYITLHPALLVNIKSLSNYKGKFNAGHFFEAKNRHKICTIAQSSNADLVAKLFPGAIIIPSKNETNRDQKLVDGGCDALLLDDYDLKKKVEENPLLKNKYKTVVLDKVETPVYVVTNPKYPNLSHFIDDLVRNSSVLQFSLETSFQQYKKYIQPLRVREKTLEQQELLELDNQVDLNEHQNMAKKE
jgi:polar amino acid transport system substrate-binding protein